MPKNARNRQCDQVFNRLIRHCHRSCETTRDGCNVLGWRLKSCFNIESLDDDQVYAVCRSIERIVRNAKEVNQQSKAVDSAVNLLMTTVDADTDVDIVNNAREQRLFHRRKVNQIPVDMTKLKRVIVVIDDNSEDEMI